MVNYVRAMNYGLKRLDALPLSLRLIREIHGELLKGVRGANRTPGEFRRSQNWIGPANCTLATATFVPPPVHEMQDALDNLEKFLHETTVYPTLIVCGLAHAQFETIHPFLDGNGRVGRLLITFLLCQRGILKFPLLYLSHYLKFHRAEYYDRLMAIRNDGHWEAWLKFFLKGVGEVSRSATETARRILELRQKHQAVIRRKATNQANARWPAGLFMRATPRQCSVSGGTARLCVYHCQHVAETICRNGNCERSHGRSAQSPLRILAILGVIRAGRDFHKGRVKKNQLRFLSLLDQLPVRLNAKQAGWVLNCQPHDIPALVAARLLKPLGNPSANGIKYFATADLPEIAKDRAWLVKMTTIINTHWQKRNAKNCRSQNGHSPLIDLSTARAS